jgi:hypothetical protein
MTVKFTNNASTTVATGINTTATSLVVASAAGFPALSGSGDYCYLTIQQAAGTNVEVVKATALSSNTFTIVRAQDGTSAGSWSVSDVVELRVTAALLTDIVDAATHDASVLSVDSTNNRVGVNDTTPSVTLDISGTDAIALPVGTTAQRPSAGAGRFRYNSSLSQFEGYTDAWGAIGGGGTNTFTTDSFTANGSLVAFNLSQTVASESNLLVFIDGVFQTQDAYAIATASGTTTLTFSAAPANARKIVVYSVAAGISGTNLNVDSMTGDGSDVTLTLTINTIKENTQVFIDGVYQAKANYSISGTTLTFSTAPPAGSAVECVTMTQTEINVPVDNTITSAKLSGALTTPAALTVTGALAANGGAVFNEGGADLDFRVESDINANGLVLLGDTGHVGINGLPTAYALEVFDTDGNGIAYKDTTNSVTSFMGAYQSVAISGTLTNHSYALWTNNTERMRILSNGSVVIGGTSLNAASSVGFTAAGQIRQVFASGVANDSLFGAISGVSNGFQITQDTSNNQSYIFHNGGSASLKIDAAGNVGIGGNPIGGAKLGISKSAGGDVFILTDTSSADLIVNCTSGVTRISPSTGILALGTGNVEKIRISGGNLLVGQTSQNQATVGSSITSTGVISTAMANGTSGANNYHLYSTNASAYRFYVGMHGTVFATSTTISAISDIRYKENIRDLDDGLSKIMALQPRKFDWKEGKGRDVKDDRGWIAQEIETVFPDLVDEWKDEAPEGEEPYKSVRPDLIPVLVKAIQEQQATIEALTQRIETLENN